MATMRWSCTSTHTCSGSSGNYTILWFQITTTTLEWLKFSRVFGLSTCSEWYIVAVMDSPKHGQSPWTRVCVFGIWLSAWNGVRWWKMIEFPHKLLGCLEGMILTGYCIQHPTRDPSLQATRPANQLPCIVHRWMDGAGGGRGVTSCSQSSFQHVSK